MIYAVLSNRRADSDYRFVIAGISDSPPFPPAQQATYVIFAEGDSLELRRNYRDKVAHPGVDRDGL